MTATADAWFSIVPEYVTFGHISANAVRVFSALHRYADRDDEAFPARATVARQIDMSVKTLDRALKELEAAGMITKARRQRPDGSYTSNLYTLHMTPKQGTLLGGPRDTGDATPRDASVARVGTPVTQHEPESLNQTHREPDRRDALFDAMCRVLGFDPDASMPDSQSKAINTALRELRKINATAQDIVEHATAYRLKHPKWDLTPYALVKWWNEVTGYTASEEQIAKARRAMATMAEPTGRIEA